MSLKTSDQTEGLWLKGMYTNVHLCAKFGDWKPTINEKLHVSEQGTETTFHKETVIFLSTKCFMNNNWSWQKLKPWVMLWDQGGDQPSKIWEKLDFSSNSAWFLRSLVSTIWREAKESNLQRSERPIGSRAVKMLTHGHARFACVLRAILAWQCVVWCAILAWPCVVWLAQRAKTCYKIWYLWLLPM